MKKSLFLLLVVFGFGANAQIMFEGEDSAAYSELTNRQSWWQKCPEDDNIIGTSSQRAYFKYVKNVEIQEVIVAVIDGGTDVNHEDLKENIWVNADEIPDNGIDDDGNGYVDDINGWSFISGPDEDVVYENMEWVRQIRRLNEKLTLTKEEAKELKKLNKRLNKEIASAETNMPVATLLYEFWEDLMEFTNDTLTAEKLWDYSEYDEATDLGRAIAESLANDYDEDTLGEIQQWRIKENFVEYYDQLTAQLEYHLNPDYIVRQRVGDDETSNDSPYYGSNRVVGDFADHGTHVAGIIGAVRNNGIGMNGMAPNAKIMVLRVVPNGDERDKDVANAIRYAVDNGAKVINMSFGKDYAYMQHEVEAAIQYAAEHDVLLVHGAGNDSKNIDKHPNYPNGIVEATGYVYPNFIEVGSTTYGRRATMVSDFSNYGKTVDIFAPGSHIYSTLPGDRYDTKSGTSMAAPVVAGTAVLLRGMFPNLSAEEIKDIILASSYTITSKVNRPGRGKTKFSKLCATGGMLNVFRCIMFAQVRSAEKTVEEINKR